MIVRAEARHRPSRRPGVSAYFHRAPGGATIPPPLNDRGGQVAGQRNVFISHVHEDDHGLQKLRDLLAPKGVEIRDSSIHKGKFNDASDEHYIKTGILAPAINWAGVFICYVSPETKSSAWVNWEIEYAAKQGKRIIGVWAYGQNECDLPRALKEYADALVGWNGDSIVDAINGKDSSEKPDGSPCDAVQLKRHPC